MARWPEPGSRPCPRPPRSGAYLRLGRSPDRPRPLLRAGGAPPGPDEVLCTPLTCRVTQDGARPVGGTLSLLAAVRGVGATSSSRSARGRPGRSAAAGNKRRRRIVESYRLKFGALDLVLSPSQRRLECIGLKTGATGAGDPNEGASTHGTSC